MSCNMNNGMERNANCDGNRNMGKNMNCGMNRNMGRNTGCDMNRNMGRNTGCNMNRNMTGNTGCNMNRDRMNYNMNQNGNMSRNNSMNRGNGMNHHNMNQSDCRCKSKDKEWGDCMKMDGCDVGNEPVDRMASGMAFVPWQKWEDIYCMEKALERGTIFEQLDKPFMGGRGK